MTVGQEVVRVNPKYDPLEAADTSTRLQAAMAIGAEADPELVRVLVARCGVEPDFFVRDMLTWALIQLPASVTVPLVVAELDSANAQARSQALHTLSKLKEPATWPAITRQLLHDPDDEVRRAAWRTAVGLVPAGEERQLAAELVTELGRGDRDVQLSLSRALVELGDAAEDALAGAVVSSSVKVQAHARATERLLRDPEANFGALLDEAKRAVALGPQQVHAHR
ncbi:HEAT repeat domain-containing protein [Kribbella sp.]|uniref:HEAT repeat domain-containing protein n=1 Tax=Kribbella sp. TaxID=1871183 RepID=UPI002D3F411F|nr:HEAT repeat domain-containing protein [Kribbella sp.]HZX06561.1 HEAT repeat domain-containing protein [Kribbella sp.]